MSEPKPDKLTEEQHRIVEKGFHAEMLLNSEAFAEAINDLSTELANRLLSTIPSEKEQREDLYNMHKGLENLVATLRAAVTAAATVERDALEDEELAKEEAKDIQ